MKIVGVRISVSEGGKGSGGGVDEGVLDGDEVFIGGSG
jgi:hypothetical protein